MKKQENIKLNIQHFQEKIFFFQVAKLSELLIELERGNILLDKGKGLDEILFDLEGNECSYLNDCMFVFGTC